MSATEVVETAQGRTEESEESGQWSVASGQSAHGSSFPQGLKPGIQVGGDGTAEAVPLQSGKIELSTHSELQRPTQATTAWVVGHPGQASEAVPLPNGKIESSNHSEMERPT